MEKYKEYIKEREGLELLESENGFVTYSMNSECFYLAEIYVRPHVRGSLEAYKLFKRCVQMAKENGCVSILGSVDDTTIGWENSVNLMTRLGFVRSGALENLLFFKKVLV